MSSDKSNWLKAYTYLIFFGTKCNYLVKTNGRDFIYISNKNSTSTFSQLFIKTIYY